MDLSYYIDLDLVKNLTDHFSKCLLDSKASPQDASLTIGQLFDLQSRAFAKNENIELGKAQVLMAAVVFGPELLQRIRYTDLQIQTEVIPRVHRCNSLQ